MDLLNYDISLVKIARDHRTSILDVRHFYINEVESYESKLDATYDKLKDRNRLRNSTPMKVLDQWIY